MNKCFRLMFVALLVICCATVAHADDLTVYDGTQVSPYVPLPTAQYREATTRGQVIYPAEELAAMAGQSINGFTLYVNDEGCKMNGGTLRVSMGEVDVTAFSSKTFFSNLTAVALVSMHKGAYEVDFDTPYTYNGGNLVIDFYVLQGGESEAYNFTYFYGVFQQGHSALTTGDEGNEYREFIPKTTFYYGEKDAVAARVNPRAVGFNTVRAGESDEQTVYLTNTGLNAFTPVVTASAPFSATVPQTPVQPGQTVEITAVFAPTSAGTFEGTMQVDCGSGVVLDVPLTGEALLNGTNFTVCDGSAKNQYVPFNGIYVDDLNTKGQMIYPAEKLTQMKNGKIVALTFYTQSPINMRNVVLQLSMMNTDQEEFAQATPITGMSVVGSANVINRDTVITFELDAPFEYTGGNLALEVKVSGTGYTSTTFFLGEATSNYASYTHYISWSGEKNEIYQFLPKATFTYQEPAEPQVIRGDVDGNGQVNVTDATVLINALLNENFSNVNMANADVDDNGSLNITDATALISFLLSGHW